jgi:hypothetical protein
MGQALGDAVAVARGASGTRSLAELNILLGGRHGPLDEQAKQGKVQVEAMSGMFDIAIGGWSHATASVGCMKKALLRALPYLCLHASALPVLGRTCPINPSSSGPSDCWPHGEAEHGDSSKHRALRGARHR